MGMAIPSPRAIADAVIKALDDRGRYPCQYDVFISFANADKSIADKILDALEKKNLKCFLSAKELVGGDDFSEVICDALRNSREVCILFTPNSAKSEWVISEWGAAWALKKKIVPIIHRIDISHLPDRLCRLQVVDAINIDKYVEEVNNRRQL